MKHSKQRRELETVEREIKRLECMLAGKTEGAFTTYRNQLEEAKAKRSRILQRQF